MPPTVPEVLPYSRLVGQRDLKRALEIAYVADTLGGVLLRGQRGTAKSTAARAFAQMIDGRLPVTLPINATDDRVIGGWTIESLMRGESEYQPGLLEEADGGMLYVDEVNLLDDYIVNIILDVSSTGVLSIQREMINRTPERVSFTLVGTMNPEEGELRPQLLDRFGLMVTVPSENDAAKRRQILDAVLEFDDARRARKPTPWLEAALTEDTERRERLQEARARLDTVDVPGAIREASSVLAAKLQLAGHRGEYAMVKAAQALAAIDGAGPVTLDHLAAVAPMALVHRTGSGVETGRPEWTEQHVDALREVVGDGRPG
jgi:magnesium chelatase subunit I